MQADAIRNWAFYLAEPGGANHSGQALGISADGRAFVRGCEVHSAAEVVEGLLSWARGELSRRNPEGEQAVIARLRARVTELEGQLLAAE